MTSEMSSGREDHADEVDDLRLAVRGRAVVRLGLVERATLLLERSRDLRLVAVRRAGVDEAEQMRGRRHDEAQADPLPDAAEHDPRAYRQLVAPMELARDVRRVLRRPVALAVELRASASPTRCARFFSVSAAALSTCEHQYACTTSPCRRSYRASASRNAAARVPVRRRAAAAPATSRSARRRAP